MRSHTTARRSALTLSCAVMVALGMASSIQAATLRLKQFAVTTSDFVRVSDVAEVVDADPTLTSKLAVVTLAPAPAVGQTIQVSHDVIRGRLTAQGIDVSLIEFTGRSVVSVKAAAAPATAATSPASLARTEQARKQVEQAVIKEIAKYVAHQQPNLGPVDISLKLTPVQIGMFAGKLGSLKVYGGTAPWIHQQTFDVSVSDGPKTARSVEVDCRILPRRQMVHLVRPVRRGQIIGEADVELRSVAPENKTAGIVQASAVVGNEASRNLHADQVVAAEDLKKVCLVQRKSIVTVTSRVGNIQISVEAEARSEGGLGDTVDLVSLDGKHRYTGRVVGYHEVRTDAPKDPPTKYRVVPELNAVRSELGIRN